MNVPHVIVFPGAQDFVVQNLNVTTSTISADRSTVSEEEFIASGMKELLTHISPGALHDSSERGDAPRCHEETRKAIQGAILIWAKKESPEVEPFLWLSGPAGTGKTAILQTMSERCAAEGILAASFFFSYRTPKTRSLRYLVPTLAYQLAQRIPALAVPILKAVHADPSIFMKTEEAQMKALILAPVEDISARVSSRSWPRIIVVDAVDECDPEMAKDDLEDCSGARFRMEKEASQRRVLEALCSGGTSFPFSILVGSRPERAIRAFFKDSQPPIVYRITLDEHWRPDTDIALLLRCHFRTLCLRFCIGNDTWPSEEIIDILVKKASGQFIYVATIMRWIEEAESCSHQDRLDTVLGLDNSPRAPNEDGPFDYLDNLYRRVISLCPAPSTSCLWLRIIHFLSATNVPAFIVDRFLESQPGDVERVLGSLYSVLSVPDDKEAKTYRFYHLSLPEFLASPRRCKDLYVADDAWINHFVLRYLAFFRERSRLNIRYPIPLPDLHCVSPREEVVNTILDFDVRAWVVYAIANDGARCCSWNFGNLYDWVHSQCPKFLPCTKVCIKWQTEIREGCERGNWTAPQGHSQAVKGRYTDRFHGKQEAGRDGTQIRGLRRASCSPSWMFLVFIAVPLLGAWFMCTRP